MAKDPLTLDSYLSRLTPDQQAELQRLRKLILAAAPQAEECICYGLPSFRLEGQVLVGMGATNRHCALYLMSSSIVKSHAGLLEKYDTSTGTVRFAPGGGLPATLVRKLVKARMAENRALRQGRNNTRKK